MNSATLGFQFKQFFIAHNQCAMKVGTDSIMLGSWIRPQVSQTVLDIGTGSGLLAIMLAQKTKNNCQIYGVDIDLDAIQQAQENAKSCPWSHKLQFNQCALQSLKDQNVLPQVFDLIVSNPPYFVPNVKTLEQNSGGDIRQREHARQTLSLTHADLLQYVNFHLSAKGAFYCVVPADIGVDFVKKAQDYHLFIMHILEVTSHKDGKVIRLLLKFGRDAIKPQTEKLSIYGQDKRYSVEYIHLCKDYYLHF